jgi:YD repeat-containing protein
LTQNGPFGPLTWADGNGLFHFEVYDALGRHTAERICTGSPQRFCATGTIEQEGTNVTFKGHRVTQSCDDVQGQCANYAYDDFDRVISRTVTSGPVDNYTYVYDRLETAGSRMDFRALIILALPLMRQPTTLILLDTYTMLRET